LAERSAATVVLKGHRSVVASGKSVFVNTSGNPGMATAGSGDVLAGIAVAYLAASAAAPRADFTPLDALRAAVYVHGLAGDLAAAELGERAVIASDLIDSLPAAQRKHASAPPARSS
jgi:NAD(P)H-hydrate epimerase